MISVIHQPSPSKEDKNSSLLTHLEKILDEIKKQSPKMTDFMEPEPPKYDLKGALEEFEKDAKNLPELDENAEVEYNPDEEEIKILTDEGPFKINLKKVKTPLSTQFIRNTRELSIIKQSRHTENMLRLNMPISGNPSIDKKLKNGYGFTYAECKVNQIGNWRFEVLNDRNYNNYYRELFKVKKGKTNFDSHNLELVSYVMDSNIKHLKDFLTESNKLLQNPSWLHGQMSKFLLKMYWWLTYHAQNHQVFVEEFLTEEKWKKYILMSIKDQDDLKDLPLALFQRRDGFLNDTNLELQANINKILELDYDDPQFYFPSEHLIEWSDPSKPEQEYDQIPALSERRILFRKILFNYIKKRPFKMWSGKLNINMAKLMPNSVHYFNDKKENCRKHYKTAPYIPLRLNHLRYHELHLKVGPGNTRIVWIPDEETHFYNTIITEQVKELIENFPEITSFRNFNFQQWAENQPLNEKWLMLDIKKCGLTIPHYIIQETLNILQDFCNIKGARQYGELLNHIEVIREDGSTKIPKRGVGLGYLIPVISMSFAAIASSFSSTFLINNDDHLIKLKQKHLDADSIKDVYEYYESFGFIVNKKKTVWAKKPHFCEEIGQTDDYKKLIIPILTLVDSIYEPTYLIGKSINQSIIDRLSYLCPYDKWDKYKLFVMTAHAIIRSFHHRRGPLLNMQETQLSRAFGGYAPIGADDILTYLNSKLSKYDPKYLKWSIPAALKLENSQFFESIINRVHYMDKFITNLDIYKEYLTFSLASNNINYRRLYNRLYKRIKKGRRSYRADRRPDLYEVLEILPNRYDLLLPPEYITFGEKSNDIKYQDLIEINPMKESLSALDCWNMYCSTGFSNIWISNFVSYTRIPGYIHPRSATCYRGHIEQIENLLRFNEHSYSMYIDHIHLPWNDYDESMDAFIDKYYKKDSYYPHKYETMQEKITWMWFDKGEEDFYLLNGYLRCRGEPYFSYIYEGKDPSPEPEDLYNPVGTLDRLLNERSSHLQELIQNISEDIGEDIPEEEKDQVEKLEEKEEKEDKVEINQPDLASYESVFDSSLGN